MVVVVVVLGEKRNVATVMLDGFLTDCVRSTDKPELMDFSFVSFLFTLLSDLVLDLILFLACS